MGWVREFKIKDVFSPMWENLQQSLNSAKWVKDLDVGEFVEGVKTDVVSGAKSIKGFMTLPIISIIVILVLVLIVWKKIF